MTTKTTKTTKTNTTAPAPDTTAPADDLRAAEEQRVLTALDGAYTALDAVSGLTAWSARAARSSALHGVARQGAKLAGGK